MIVYHGSNRNFRTLRISSKLVNYESTLNNEGLGIYFSTDRNIANSYGKYLYTLEINDKYFRDLRREQACIKYLREIIEHVYKCTKIEIHHYIDMDTVVKYMYCGGVSLYNLSRELNMLLVNNESFYTSTSQTARDKMLRCMRAFEKDKLKVYMFTHSIKNIGVIKDVGDDIVRIINKENLGILL